MSCDEMLLPFDLRFWMMLGVRVCWRWRRGSSGHCWKWKEKFKLNSNFPTTFLDFKYSDFRVRRTKWNFDYPNSEVKFFLFQSDLVDKVSFAEVLIKLQQTWAVCTHPGQWNSEITLLCTLLKWFRNMWSWINSDNFGFNFSMAKNVFRHIDTV